MGEVLVWAVWIVAAIALLSSGLAVVLFANPFYSALALIGNLASLAVLYLLLSAEFVAAAQVLVYAGAVVIMFVFVIGYLGYRAEAPWAGGPTLQTVAGTRSDHDDDLDGDRTRGDHGGETLEPRPAGPRRVGAAAEIGDHEQEHDDDRSGVDEHLGGCHELRREQQVQDGERREIPDQRESAVERIREQDDGQPRG